MTRLLCALPFALLPAMTMAQDNSVTVLDCDWQASAAAIVEPWEENSRTFSNGKTRLALLDTVEPAAAWAWMLVLSPPYSELGDRQCKVIGVDGSGFSGMDFAALTASYDPATGLTFTVPVRAYNSEIADFDPFTLRFTLNQATGAIDGQILD
ncbi:hypothetical protein [Mameliella sediminis]|uniref:hypothetical protein n=1 Tax=Mameliella sediminis TaxID=2836866 RepID=UPI001C4686CC|nr:hypothetical protein [Mameliella sediminis]MBY6113116.1 hypothetical protein [Antarctobacter heliothermus]MBY6143536.1 hypothetical protein [Mameliella alba]MBV7394399.1 hypothetical protein [Mameliella sediminis]MBY6162616.1 hypothetical protein [Mameliella alba]MBY6172359.1 hypothetical protein [Mameliella alba]